MLVKLSLSFSDDVLENKTTRIRLGQAFNSQKGEEKNLGIKIVVKKFEAIQSEDRKSQRRLIYSGVQISWKKCLL